MQKRLLALVATVAMVLSMFAGIAFAAGEAYALTLDKAKYVLDGTKVEVKMGLVGTDAAKTPVAFTDFATSGIKIIDKSTASEVSTASPVLVGGSAGQFTVELTLAVGTYTMTWQDAATTPGVSTTAEFEVATPASYTLTLDKAKYALDGTKVEVKMGLIGTDVDKTPVAISDFNAGTIAIKKASDGSAVGTASPVLVGGGAGQFTVQLTLVAGTYTMTWKDSSSELSTEAAFTVAEAPSTDKAVEIVLDEDTFYQQERARDIITVIGEIVDADGKLVDKNIVLDIAIPHSIKYNDFSDMARYGKINIELPGDAPVGDYTVTVRAGQGYKADPVTFTVLFDEVSADDEFSFDWTRKDELFEYSARLPIGVYAKHVRLIGGGLNITDSDPDLTVAGRWVDLEISKSRFTKPGALTLQYSTEAAPTDDSDWVTFATGKINKVDISSRLTLNPATVIYDIGSQYVDVDLDLEDLYLDSTVSNNSVTFSLGSILKNDGGDFVDSGGKIVSADHRFTRTFTSSNYGSHTVKAVVKVNGETAYEATKTFTVEHPGSTNILGVPEKITVAEGFNFAPKAYYENDKGDLVEAYRYEITYSGPGLTERTVKLPNADDGDFFKLAVQQAGVYTLVIEAFDAKGNLVADETFEVKATGATMTVEPNVVELKQAADIVVTLVNEDEKPINNATIKFYEAGYKSGDAPVVSFSSTKLNPNNGVYEIELKATNKLVQNAGDYTLVAEVDGEKVVSSDFTVLGKTVYEVETDLDNGVLAGRKTKATISVTKGGKVAFPYEFAVYDEDGKLVDTYSYTRSGDDCKVEFTFTEAGEYTIIARNANHSEIGKATFEVVEPVLELSVEKLTNNTNSVFVAKLLDPTNDNKVLKWNVSVKPAYAKLQALELDGKKINVGGTLNLGKLEEYELDVTMTADYKAAEKAEKVSGLQFVVKDNAEVVIDAVMPIANAKLVSVPEQPVVGESGELTLKLVDANEAPLAGYKVTRDGNEVGKTDENGEVVYRGRMTDTMNFKANLDAVIDKVTQTVSVVVTPVDDYVKPTVEYEEEVNTAKTTIVISDNVRLTRIRINGEDIDFFAADKYEYVANLKLGENKFVIEAQDSSYNVLTETITINYVTSDVVLKGDQVKRQGEFVFVQLRQFEELGAQIAWNQATKTATFIVGETKVEVTIGSTTAKVNGETVTMPAAPFIANDRTFVPVRFVSENLGWGVHWAQGDVITITLP